MQKKYLISFVTLIFILFIMGLATLIISCGPASSVSTTSTISPSGYNLVEGIKEGGVASQYPPNERYPTLQDYTNAQVFACQFTSRFDGFVDHFFLHFPPNYDKTKAVPLILWFHAYGLGDGAVDDARMFNGDPGETGAIGVPQLYNAIVIGLPQRNVTRNGTQYNNNWLGDYYYPGSSDPNDLTTLYDPSDPRRVYPKQDIKELINQIASRFNISHVFAAGSSMGGYIPLRLIQLYPELVSGAISSAPALQDTPAQHPDDPSTQNQERALGRAAILSAADAGVYDDKLVYVIVATGEALIQHEDLLASVRSFEAHILPRNSTRTGIYYYREVQSNEIPPSVFLADSYHVNFLSDDWNLATINKNAWLTNNTVLPNLQSDINTYLQQRPRTLNPTTDWVPPRGNEPWYFTQDILDLGGRNYVRWTPQ